MTSEVLKGGLIGCGFFAVNQMHGWQEIEGVEIVAICDRDRARLTEIGDKFDVDARYSDAAEMLAAEKLDFVDIATTVESHRALVELAARHGLHVICQKPLAETMEDARAMNAAVADAGRVFMGHENFRWQSGLRAAIDAVRAGKIGEPFFCRASFRSGYDVYSGQPYLATDERFIIQDLGIHVLDVTRAIMGEVSTLSASIQRVNPKIRGEDVATILLKHDSGATSVVDCSYATRRQPETFPETLLEIDGETGTLRLDAGYRLTIQTAGGEDVIDVSPRLYPWAEKPWHNIQESVATIQRHFAECLRQGRSPETSGHDNLRTLALVEGAYFSAAEARTIKPEEL